MRCYRKLQTISCQNRIINEEVRKQIRGAIGFHNDLPWSTKEKSDDAATSHVLLIWKRQVFNAQLKGLEVGQAEEMVRRQARKASWRQNRSLSIVPEWPTMLRNRKEV